MTSKKRFDGESRERVVDEIPGVMVAATEARVYRQLFDRESLAEYLRLSTDTVDRLVKAGKLPCVRIGSQVRFTLEDVDGFIERHRALGARRDDGPGPESRRGRRVGRASRSVSRECVSRSRDRATGCGGRATSISMASSARPAASSARATRSRTRPSWSRELNRDGRARRACRRWREFLEQWPQRFPRHPRTQATNTERIRHYLLPLLPDGATCRWTSSAAPICATCRTRCCGGGWPRARSTARSRRCRHCCATRSTSSSSTPTRRRGCASGPRTRDSIPERGPVRRRAVPPAEIHAFMARSSRRIAAVCWAPVLTGCRPGELFAMHADEIDPETQMIYLHETVDRYGRLMPG